MPTTFTSLRVKGAAYVGGALTIVGAAAFAAITATTGDFTGQVQAPSFSGSTFATTTGGVEINGSSVDAATLSGATIRTTAGDTIINSSGIDSVDTLSGGLLVVNKVGAGTGQILVGGSTGGSICMKNTAGTYQVITVVSSTLTVRPALAGDACNP